MKEMRKLINGILNDKFIINRYGDVNVNDEYCGSEIGSLQGWYTGRGIELHNENEEAYKIAREFLENFIIDTRNLLANLKKEDVVRLDCGTWMPQFEDIEYPCYEFAVEITDEKYAKYFEEYQGKKYLILMTESNFKCNIDTYFNENICDDYSVKTFLDWQEGAVEIRLFKDGRYNRVGVDEDDKALNHIFAEDHKIYQEYQAKIEELEKKIKELEDQRRVAFDKKREETTKALPQAKPEFDLSGFDKTKEMLRKMGEDICKEVVNG